MFSPPAGVRLRRKRATQSVKPAARSTASPSTDPPPHLPSRPPQRRQCCEKCYVFSAAAKPAGGRGAARRASREKRLQAVVGAMRSSGGGGGVDDAMDARALRGSGVCAARRRCLPVPESLWQLLQRAVCARERRAARTAQCLCSVVK